MNARSSGTVWPRRLLGACLLCLALIGTWADPAWSAKNDEVTLNFFNADLDGVIKAISEITGKNFVVDPRVKGSVTIMSAKPVSKAKVYELFLAALRLQGFAAVEDQGIVKIVPSADAKLDAAVVPSPRGPGEQVQTKVFALKYESAAQLVPILRPLIAPYNTVTAYAANNTLVVTDYAANLARVASIIAAIDQPSGPEPVVIPLHYASALDLVQTVSKLFGDSPQAAPGGAASHMTVVADARSNSLIARSDDRLRLARLRGLIAVLDAPTSAMGNMHVVYLRNAEATKVAETLRAIYQGESGSTGTRESTPLSSAATGGGGSSFAPTPTSGSSSQSPGTSASTSMSSAYGRFSPSGKQALAPGIIQADPPTNSIIINAPDAIYNNLRAVIDKLDVRPEQVYVEALIAEITSDKAAEFGIQWQSIGPAGAGDNSARGFGGTNFGGTGQNIIGISQNPASMGPGLSVGVVKGTINIPGVGQILNMTALLRALETDADANILSTPTLLTLDNEEARIVIGQNVPFITGQYALTGGATTPTPFQTIERYDVGLVLHIKPQISEGGMVRMQIYQEVSSVVDNTNPAGPITNKRAVESTIVVKDGQIAVIGGLLQDSIKDGVQKVPLLGDIPGLGALFRYNTRARSKTNLMIFLRPVVLNNDRNVDSVTRERYNYVLGVQKNSAPEPSVVLPSMPPPELPEYQPRVTPDSMWNLPR
jgi:general secretion pathway protein D